MLRTSGFGFVLIGLAIGGQVSASEKVAPPRVIYANARQELSVYPSPYANYLVGRFAMAQGDVSTAAKAMSAATIADPSNGDLREKAFLISILGGDIDRAATVAQGMTATTDTSQLMVSLVGAIRAVKADKPAPALKSIDALLKVNPHDRNGLLLRPYILAMNGQWKAAFDESGDATLQDNDRDRLLSYLVKADRARINEIKGNKADAEAIYKSLYQPGAASFIFGPDYAGFLERQGRTDEAKTIWQAIVDQTNDVVAQQALKRLANNSGRAPALPGLTESMAQALFVSSTVSFSEHDSEFALASLHLSLYLDNKSDRERIFLGQVQSELKDTEAADAAWASIKPDSPFYNESILRRVWAMRGDDKLDPALALVDQALSRDPDNLSLIVEKTGILHAMDKDADALALLDARIQRAGDTDFGWQALYTQAIVYEGLDRWSDAEVAIKKAQALNGNQPEILNFLGYGWVNRGEQVDQGMDLIRQALKVSPKSGAIIDSLGWGYYKKGQYDQALDFIEQAVQMEPADPEINEHLGDVYKALGRSTEAGYEWQRVLTLKTTERQAETVRKKLDANAASLKMADSKPKATTTALNDERKSRP
ncbi:tetratricopeptide repeat protein [Asticcacaulis sp.]|uniref:tetratricopeptide repeat protein n=1 Tax=Asticcacaulis sp. TaxID=1872648 RepID=UPI002C2A2B2E|nr:tetratricopeptide repeat protein [Asticcacaulis sp.]HTM83238.1 tetratricopeptide repeat protein [Asticcacaulis sp.]